MKNLIKLLLVFCLAFPSLVFGQTKPNYVGEWYQRAAQGKVPQQANIFSRDSSDFVRTKRYNLKANINQLNSILQTEPALLNLVVPFGDKTYTLNLSRVEVTTGDFSVNTGNGKVKHSKNVQYRGIVDNNPQHIASLSLSTDEIAGFFSTQEGNFTISKDGLKFIVYNQDDMPDPEEIICVTPDVTYQVNAPTALVPGVGCKTVNVYLECDYAFYQSKGSNVSTLTNYVLGFFNQVATLYANENIAIQISEMFVWTTPDPYTSLTSTSSILTAFKANRGTSFNGHLAHFLTSRSLGGGIAYVNTLCNKSYAYGVSMVYGTYNDAPMYSWTVEVVTHELGHNLGSPHTHSCSWATGALDNCYTPEGSCVAGPQPVNGGTIMSYCHTKSTGINFNNGFGFYPGNLIRDKVLNATCISGGTSTAAPTSLSTTNITQSSATLNWVATPGATNYTVQYKLASATSWIPAGTTALPTFNLTGLSGATNYVWTVRSDCSSFAPNASFATTGQSTCSAPLSLTTSNITQTSATLNWASVVGATSYSVQYKLASATSWLSAGTTSAQTINISGLSASSSYVWTVKANCSGFSTNASFTTSGQTSCAVPTSLTTSNITQTSATLNWTAVSGATSYTAQYKLASATTWISAGTTSAQTINISGLSASSSYVWTVKANCSGFASNASFTTSAQTSCAVPTSLSTSNITQTSATLNWAAVSGATSYTAQYKLASATTWISAGTTSAQTVNISGLTGASNYIWTVKANCSGFASNASFSTSGQAPCSVPTSLTTTNITQTGATLNWAAVAGATSYTVQYKTSAATTWTTFNTATNSYVLSGLVAGTNYNWLVKANCSANSAIVNFTTGTTTTPPPSTGCIKATNLFETNITNNSAQLNWTGEATAQSYQVQIREVGSLKWTNYNVTSPTATVRLKPNRNYEWTVNTKCSNGVSSGPTTVKRFISL